MNLARLEKYYINFTIKELKNRFRYRNNLCIPKIIKVIVYTMDKNTINNDFLVKRLYEELYIITGQKPIISKSKKSIASFKLRKGMKIGVKVTLRKKIMYEFLDKLINIALPRIKDFKGLKNNQFDKNNNFSLGIKEQIIFPEINYNKVDKVKGLGIVIVTSSKRKEEAKFLLKSLNFPFQNQI